MRESLAASSRRISGERSLEPSSMTMSSKSVNVCFRIESIVSAMYRSVLYTGTTTETVGDEVMEC